MTTWSDLIDHESKQDYFQQTLQFISDQRAQGITIYPAENKVFNALTSTPFAQVKVVILGQDPYHGANQAHGLSFSVPKDIKIPPSLKNIYKELGTDIKNFTPPNHGYLQAWAEQGVLLLNTVLTVEQGHAHSHQHLGWEIFTDKLIQQLSEQTTGIIFLLWGAHAQKKGKCIDRSKHYLLTAAHPSPLSAYRGFFGCRHFSKTNEILTNNSQAVINWCL